MTKIIGLTGGIGSGKTFVAHLFKEIGVPIYLSDVEAKKISESEAVNVKIKSYFGKSVFDNGVLNRKKLGEIVFNDSVKLELLNGIIHPLVKTHFNEWVKKQNTAFVLKESAILFESNSEQSCDVIISIEAPIDERINRVVERDSTGVSDVEKRMKMQLSDEERRAKSDFVIFNLDREKTKNEVHRIWGIIKKNNVNI